MNTTYRISKQDGEFIVANADGMIIGYFDTRAMAQDYRDAQQRDDERAAVESAFNTEQQAKALRAEYRAEFA